MALWALIGRNGVSSATTDTGSFLGLFWLALLALGIGWVVWVGRLWWQWRKQRRF
jgi:hypothetical protein